MDRIVVPFTRGPLGSRAAFVSAARERICRYSALLAMTAFLSPAVHAMQPVHQNLTQMIHAADQIVTGEVVKVTDGIERGVPFTQVTIKVKGSHKKNMKLDSLYTFRQFGLQKNRKMRDGRYMLATRIEGWPSWTVGEHVMTFMNKPASGTGLVTPVGLSQGKLISVGGKLSNSFSNVGLLQDVKIDPSVLSADEAAMLAKGVGALDQGALTGLVNRAVKENWIGRGVMH
jgi:hypothetical protein